jgi:hypothetical protein
MAVKKTSRSASPKKASSKKTASKGSTAKKAAPKKAAGTAKKAAPKKAAGPKLSPAQSELLKKVARAGGTGYQADKKPENKALESLLKHKLLKKGKKSPGSTSYHYKISSAGQKQLNRPYAVGGLGGETDTEPPTPKSS